MTVREVTPPPSADNGLDLHVGRRSLMQIAKIVGFVVAGLGALGGSGWAGHAWGHPQEHAAAGSTTAGGVTMPPEPAAAVAVLAAKEEAEHAAITATVAEHSAEIKVQSEKMADLDKRVSVDIATIKTQVTQIHDAVVGDGTRNATWRRPH